MATQPETGVWEDTIYEIATDDPVEGGEGGISNSPLLQLANRTGWLYAQLNELIDGTTIPSTVAPLNSPTFTGTVKAPTPARGDNSTTVSTTAFVQNTVYGVLTLSVAGAANVTLTAIQAGNGTLIFTGALTASIAVIVPATAKRWIVQNSTTGAYTLTVKTASGTGVAVAQGKIRSVWCDGTNVLASLTDFPSVALTGSPTAPTAAVGDQSTAIATTAFAYSLKSGVVTVPVGGNTNVTLTAAQYGVGIILLTGVLTGSIDVIVPAQGGTYVIANNTTGAYSLYLASAGGGSTALVPSGQSVVAYCDSTNVILAGAAANSSFTKTAFTATAGQTDFAVSYTPGNVLVMVNGAVQSAYTATDGANVVMSTGLLAGDEVVVIAFASFTVANALTTTQASSLYSQTATFGTDAGTATAYSVTLTPAPASIPDGFVVRWRAATTNTGASTLSVNSSNAYAIQGAALAALAAGEIVAGGYYEAAFNANTSVWILKTNTAGPLQVATPTAANHAAQLQQVVGNVGDARNLSATLLTAGTSLTYTADNLIVKTALNGLTYCIPSLNAKILSTATGAGGISSSSTMPASGFLAIYAIYNPTTATAALLGVNATSAKAPEICAATMPADYTASALIGVWPTTSDSYFNIADQAGRVVTTGRSAVINTSTSASSLTAVSLASAAPINAKFGFGDYSATAAATSSNVTQALAATASGIGNVYQTALYYAQCAWRLRLITPQVLYYLATSTGTLASFVIYICGYEF